MAYILGVDIGTSGTKTVLFSEDGTPVGSATYEYPLYTPQNGYAEQEPARLVERFREWNQGRYFSEQRQRRRYQGRWTFRSDARPGNA